VAIKRPDLRAAGPRKKKDSGDAVAVATVIDTKKKAIASKKSTKKSAEADSKNSLTTNKKQGSKKPATNKKDKKAPAKKRVTAPKNEREWIQHIEGMKLSDLLSFLESKGGKLNVTALSAVNGSVAKINRMLTPLPSDYNAWLDYFSSMTNSETETFLETHVLTLDNEAVAAGKRWLQIYENPALIDRIVTSRLQQAKSEEIGNILTAAKSGDRIKTFEALRDNLAYKLQDGSGARDMTVLIKQLNEVMVTLDELYRETGRKDDGNSSIRKLLVRSRKMASRPRASQAATKISDVESDDDEEDY